MMEVCEFSGGPRALKERGRVLFHGLCMVCRSFGQSHIAARLLLVVDAGDRISIRYPSFVGLGNDRSYPSRCPVQYRVDFSVPSTQPAAQTSSRLPVLIIRVYNSGLEGVLGSGGFDAEEIHGGVSSG